MFIYVLQIKTKEEDKWHDCDLDTDNAEPWNAWLQESDALTELGWRKEAIPEYDWRLEKRHYILNYVYGAYP